MGNSHSQEYQTVEIPDQGHAHAPEKPERRSRKKPGMGKEVKIGLTVILLLIITLGAVVVNRLRGAGASAQNESVASSSDGTATADSGSAETQDAGSASHTAGALAAAPKVVSATPASSASPKPPVSDDELWGKTSESKKTRDEGLASASSAGPSQSYMPARRSHEPSSGDRYARASSKPAENTAKQPDPFGIPDAKGEVSSDSVPTQAVETPPAPAPILDDAPSAAPEPSNRYAARYSEEGASSRYQAPEPPARPSYRDEMNTNRYGSSDASGNRRGRDPHDVNQHYGAPSRDSYPGRSSQAPRTVGNYGGPREDGTYVSAPNDSYWTIAERTYGSGAYFKALLEYNRDHGVSEEQLKIGTKIKTPSLVELEKRYPQLCPKSDRVAVMKNRMTTVSTRVGAGNEKTYVVVEGDSLFDIARSELGKASRWVEIYELNRDALGKDFDYLPPGTKLILPGAASSSADPVTRRPGATYQR